MPRWLHMSVYLVCEGLSFIWMFAAVIGGIGIGFVASSRPLSEIAVAMGILAFMAIMTPPIRIGMEKWGNHCKFPPYY